MTHRKSFMPIRCYLLMLGICVMLGCDGASKVGGDADAAGKKREQGRATAQEAPTNRIDIPESVRRNLGITFAKVESRAVLHTIRVPGQFELLPHARREYRTMVGGRVELHVTQYERIEPGKLLYSLDSPAWRELQERLNATDAAIQQAEARSETIEPLMAAHGTHEQSLQAAVEVWSKRVEQLQQSSSGVVTAEELAQTQGLLATNRAELADVLEKQAELDARRVEVRTDLAAARERFELLMMNAASMLGIEKGKLEEPVDPAMERHARAQVGAERHALWREVMGVDVRAARPGIVESVSVTNGSWVDETSLVLTTVQPELLRFRARALQSDLGRFRDGLPARIVPPKGGSIALQDTMEGTATLGLGADPQERTVELLVTPATLAGWARFGMAAFLEIVVEGGQEELAIPLSAVIQDGLQKIIFRRDPKDPDKVIRVEADLGIDDGRWVVIKSGVREGDEVVLDGVYQLMLASSGTAQKGGHFHADGTFHAGEEE